MIQTGGNLSQFLNGVKPARSVKVQDKKFVRTPKPQATGDYANQMGIIKPIPQIKNG